MEAFQLLETVIATVDMPAYGIVAGDVGTIADVYTQGSLAYEVEFSCADGSTRISAPLAPAQLRNPTQADVLTTRRVSPPE
jgi:hypothetical protein